MRATLEPRHRPSADERQVRRKRQDAAFKPPNRQELAERVEWPRVAEAILNGHDASDNGHRLDRGMIRWYGQANTALVG
jgi:hypothetical protein